MSYRVHYNFFETDEKAIEAFSEALEKESFYKKNTGMESEACFSSFNYRYKENFNEYLSIPVLNSFDSYLEGVNNYFKLFKATIIDRKTTKYGMYLPLIKIETVSGFTNFSRFISLYLYNCLLRLSSTQESVSQRILSNVDKFSTENYIINANASMGKIHAFYERELTKEMLDCLNDLELINSTFVEGNSYTCSDYSSARPYKSYYSFESHPRQTSVFYDLTKNVVKSETIKEDDIIIVLFYKKNVLQNKYRWFSSRYSQNNLFWDLKRQIKNSAKLEVLQNRLRFINKYLTPVSVYCYGLGWECIIGKEADVKNLPIYTELLKYGDLFNV